jgi:hypothetical protein
METIKDVIQYVLRRAKQEDVATMKVELEWCYLVHHWYKYIWPKVKEGDVDEDGHKLVAVLYKNTESDYTPVTFKVNLCKYLESYKSEWQLWNLRNIGRYWVPMEWCKIKSMNWFDYITREQRNLAKEREYLY